MCMRADWEAGAEAGHNCSTLQTGHASAKEAERGICKYTRSYCYLIDLQHVYRLS